MGDPANLLSLSKKQIEKFSELLINVMYLEFQFLWDALLIFCVGYRSPRHWHTEDFSPKIAVLQNEKQKIITTINMQEKGLAVFSEVYYPNGWQCKINNINSDIIDVNGRIAESILHGNLSSGTHSFNWFADNNPSSIYFIRVQSGEESIIRKIKYIK